MGGVTCRAMAAAYTTVRHDRGEDAVAIEEPLEIRVDGEPLDAIRIAPASVRAFEAGPKGLDVLALGPHRAGDAEMVRMSDFWPA